MAVTILSQQKSGPNTWTLSWTSTLANPTFYVYQNGILISITQSNSGIISVSDSNQLIIEVLDSATQTPAEVYDGIVVIGWYQTPNTTAYKIEEWNGSAWTTVATVTDIGNWWNTWTSPLLPDCQPYQFKVTPIGTNGNNGQSQTFTGFMVRIPDAPQANYLLNSDSTVTLS
ncbi:MAG: hypothetical protein WCL60_01365 [Methylococcales bacterium]|jgi:hypothetical protein